jgi:hypothetical protein
MIAISTEEIEKLEKSRTPQFNQFLHRLQIGKFTRYKISRRFK